MGGQTLEVCTFLAFTYLDQHFNWKEVTPRDNIISIIVLIAVSLSLAASIGVFAGSLYLGNRQKDNWLSYLLGGALLALLFNSWWILGIAWVVYKLFILGQDP